VQWSQSDQPGQLLIRAVHAKNGSRNEDLCGAVNWHSVMMKTAPMRTLGRVLTRTAPMRTLGRPAGEERPVRCEVFRPGAEDGSRLFRWAARHGGHPRILVPS
jgi:hypothetical protein